MWNRRPRAIIPLWLLLLSCSACSGSDSSSTTDAGSVIDNVEYDHAKETMVYRSTAGCMASRGYTLRSVSGAIEQTGVAVPTFDRNTVQQRGSGLTAGVIAALHAEADEPGVPPETDEYMAAIAACSSAAEREFLARYPEWIEYEALRNQFHDDIEALNKSSVERVKFFSKWSVCMDELGFSGLENPAAMLEVIGNRIGTAQQSANPESALNDVLRFDIAVSLANFDCADNLKDPMLAERSEREAAFTERHQLQLQQLKSKLDALLADAE